MKKRVLVILAELAVLERDLMREVAVLSRREEFVTVSLALIRHVHNARTRPKHRR